MSSIERIQDFLSRSAARTPLAPFLVLPKGRVSYAEAEANSNKMARALVELGVARGDRVAILATNTPEYVASYYGAMKCGGIAVPVNTSIGAAGLRNLLEDCGARVLLREGRFAELAEESLETGSGLASACSVVDPLEATAGIDNDQPIPCPASSGDPASIIYTSGSTGRPRGAVLSHGNLIANTESIVSYLRLTAVDRMMVILPFYYVYGKSLLNTHACVGGSLILGTDLFFPNDVVSRIEADEATGLAGVPSTFTVLIHRSRLSTSVPPSLRYMTQAGGAMSPELTREIMGKVPGVDLFVMYGATEASARLSYLDPVDLERKIGSIGKAIPGVTLSVLGANGNEVATGETGELVARGSNIMQGYWNDPEETARVLGPRGLYTGDLARKDEEEFLYIVGRKKEMIKSGSHRISPKEIEETLVEHPSVLEAAVIGVPDTLLGEAIRAFVVLREGEDVDATSILRFVGERLPDYKVPGSVAFRASLPKNESGKVQKRRLTTEADSEAGADAH